MYHYVRGNSCRPPYGYYHLDIDDFRAQLDYFESEFGFVEREAFLNCIYNKTPVPDGVVLTFDDGLVDHYEWVLPELLSRDLWGIFYVPTGPLQNGEVLDVHRIHSLIGSVDVEQLFNEIKTIVTKDMIPDQYINEFQKSTYQNHSSPDMISDLKRILNYFISYDCRKSVLNKLEKSFPNSRVDASELYMTKNQVAELDEQGMIVGSHTITHNVLSKLTPSEQRMEINDSFNYLEKSVDVPMHKSFCYPYGGKHTYSDTTIEILENCGCDWSFDVRSEDITSENLDMPHTLPRYDTCEFPHGSASFHF